jgi:hypothetical protein
VTNVVLRKASRKERMLLIALIMVFIFNRAEHQKTMLLEGRVWRRWVEMCKTVLRGLIITDVELIDCYESDLSLFITK